jgi:uncharacterized protein (TIGR02231 family)
MNPSSKRNRHTKMYVLLILLSLGFSTLAQSPKTYTPKLQKVTVYLQGAHLYYNENVTLQAGNNELIFENISPYINVASLQAASKGAVVMEVKHQIKYKEKAIATRKYDKEIENVLDSLEDIAYAMKDIDNKVYVLETEKSMLMNNRIIKGQQLRDSLPTLRDGMAFLKEKLNSIYEQSLKLERMKAKLQKQKNKLDTRYSSLLLLQSGQEVFNRTAAQQVNQVVVTLFCDAATTTQVNFNYFVQNASWVPVYDLQATSSTNNFNLKYFANVTQSTGVEWTSVPLTLSTSNPTETNVKPELSPWYLSFMEYLRNDRISKTLSNAWVPMQMESLSIKKKSNSDGYDDVEEDQKYVQNYVQITESIIRTEYEIKLNYTIAADGKMHKVLINQKEVPMIMEFAAVPKVCTDAFLMAKVTGWEDMNILPGNARLYFDGGYVGEMYLDASTTSDTLNVNLGRDKTIAITRKKIKEDVKEKIFADDKVETRTIEIVVRNTKNVPVEIVLEDQIPIATGTNEIRVDLFESDGATLDVATGKLTWKVKLKVKDTKKITFTYQIRYPKGKTIAGL